MVPVDEESKKPNRSKFQRHASVLIWKCFLQRQRRWKLLLVETVIAATFLIIAVLIAKPVFLTPLRAEPILPLKSADLLASLQKNTIIGYAPEDPPYPNIMNRTAELLKTDMIAGATENDLNKMLYSRAKKTPLNGPVLWVIWKPKEDKMWKFSIRSTERAQYAAGMGYAQAQTERPNLYLRSGFLAVQAAVSQAVIEYSRPSASAPQYEISLVSMPVSPLMQEHQVRKALTGILLCLTLALIPSVIETQALVVNESMNRFKRALRIRGVDYSTVYIAWLTYAYMTAFPVCLLCAITLILIFRWIHLVFAFLVVLAYVSVMITFALIMAMFHTTAWVACLWSVLLILLKTFFAELVVHYGYDAAHAAGLLLHLALPPLGLVHALNEFAMLQTGRGASQANKPSLFYTVASWTLLNLFYFALLMVLQRTLRDTAIGGEVSWKSIFFKKREDVNKLRPIITPTGTERRNLQVVDELVAKAISFRNVSKSIMGVSILKDINLDIYRGEYTMLFTKEARNRLIIAIEDLITGVTYPDEGSITVLGHTSEPGHNFMTSSHMMGYCHSQKLLLDDLTVEEHLVMFAEISLWNESKQFLTEYQHIRVKRLLKECDLDTVRRLHVGSLGTYYRAQLCWAIAMLLEPRIVVIPALTDKPTYIRVIKDKIMNYKRYISIVMMSHSTIQMECSDRVFIFYDKFLVFGGTPAYLFFKYGREYRVRVSFRSGATADNISELLSRVAEAGATVRAHLGSLLVLRLPVSPTAAVAALVKDLYNDAAKYGVNSINISLPDTEEVCKRAINEARTANFETDIYSQKICMDALQRIAETRQWKRKRTYSLNLISLRVITWKFVSFYLYFKWCFAIVMIAAAVAGILIGVSLSNTLLLIASDQNTWKLLQGEILTVEALKLKTNLIIRCDNTSDARSVANAYVLSETKATEDEVKLMTYTALSKPESLTEYLVTRAIDSPQHYVYMYAYGMDVSRKSDGALKVNALYSPLNHDEAAAARSLARVYMALLRHYTKALDATIEITDDPLSLDLTPWMGLAGKPSLLIQFLLVLSVSHMTLLPSMEHRLIRHVQCHALNFSPARYWLSLFFCDLIFLWALALIITAALFCIVYFTVPMIPVSFSDIVIVPSMMAIYVLGCIPQAYLFSIGPRPALNSLTFIIVNIVFGETTILAKLFYGNALNYAMYFMRLSPQFNIAYGYVKILYIFLYNSECVLFKTKELCSLKILHKCCAKCGVLQECFSRKSYFTATQGVLVEMFSIILTSMLFMMILLFWEYRVIQRLWITVCSKVTLVSEQQTEAQEANGVERERVEVTNKLKELTCKRKDKVVTFGENLLSRDISIRVGGLYHLKNISFGVGKGEILGLSCVKPDDRAMLCEILAGSQTPSSGELWCMSKWKLKSQPNKYCQQISLSIGENILPPWMTAQYALILLAVLRGVPWKYIAAEIRNYVDALDLGSCAKTPLRDLRPNEQQRVQFAAAVVGAPSVLVLDDCTASQRHLVKRAMYSILNALKKRGRAIFLSGSSVEAHLPVTNRIAILVNGCIVDIDHVDTLVERHSQRGYTVVVHLKDDVDITRMFAYYFKKFVVNDTSEVLVNVQVLDTNLSWPMVFEKMEKLQEENAQVYSYIVSAVPIDYIYNNIVKNEYSLERAPGVTSTLFPKTFFTPKNVIMPHPEVMHALKTFDKKYDITKLEELPWSVVFNT